MIFYPIPPTPAPRQVRRDRYAPSPSVLRYRAFRDEVRRRKVTIPLPFYHVIFCIAMPRTWSRRRRNLLAWTGHRSRPDRDNLEKALLDSVFGEDAHVWDGRTTKVWTPTTPGFLIADHNIGCADPVYLSNTIGSLLQTEAA